MNAKLRKLILKHGAEGYAVYFHCLELITGDLDENNITFELEHDAEIIADNLKIKSESDISAIDKVNNIMREIVRLGLFQESEGRIFCFKLLKRLDQSMTSNHKMRQIIHEGKENHDLIMINHDTVMKDKKRRDKIRKDKNKENVPPTREELRKYIEEKKLLVNPDKFLNHYESKGWMIGKSKMKSWQAAARGWHIRESEGKADNRKRMEDLI